MPGMFAQELYSDPLCGCMVDASTEIPGKYVCKPGLCLSLPNVELSIQRLLVTSWLSPAMQPSYDEGSEENGT